MYHRISVLVPVLVRVPEYLSTSTSTSMSTITLVLTSTSTVRVPETQYSSTASTSTECEYPSPAQCANTLLLKQNSFYFADDILICIFEFVLLLHMQLSYLKMNLKSWSAKYRPYCLCRDVLTRCGRDKVTSILKTTFSFSFLTSGEI